MTHFTERKHLIKWIMENCTRRSVVRAMDEGAVEHLGAFKDIGPSPVSLGWIVRVKSYTGKTWLLEIVPTNAHRFGIYITECHTPDDSPLWDHWVGDHHSDPLYSGDYPIEYARLRNERRAEIAKENRVLESTE